MTITVELPDGRRAEFPDGTSREDIKRAMQKLAQKEAPGVAPPAAPPPAADTGPQRNPDGTYGEVPPGMVLDPRTGSYTSAELMANNMQPGVAASMMSGANQGLTLGMGDEINGALNALVPGAGTMGERYAFAREQARALSDAARRDHPVAAYGSEIAGAVALPGAITAKSFAGQLGQGAALGGIYGGLYGAGAAEGGLKDRALGALAGGGLGAAGGVAGAALGAGIQKVADQLALGKAMRAAAKGAPATDELRAMGRAAYGEVDKAGVQFTPEAVGRMSDDIAAALKGEGAGYSTASNVMPGSYSVLGALDDVGKGAPGANGVSFQELDQLRRFAGNAAASTAAKGNANDARVATEALSMIDDFVSKATPADIAAGDVEALQTALPKAREIWTRMSKSQKIDDAIEAGGGYLSGTGSGIRWQFKRIAQNPKLARGFTKAEMDVIRRVANGSLPEKLLHIAGGGLGNIATVAGGAAGGGLPGAAVGGLLTAGIRKASDAVTMRKAEIARAIMANGGIQKVAEQNPVLRQIVERLAMKATAPALLPR